MAKLERLMNLTAALLETSRPLTAEELRTRVEGYPDELVSFRRAFERDKDDLREMGIPLTMEKVPGTDPLVDGYRIRKQDYYLTDPGLEPDELAALHLAASTVRFDGVSGAEALWKLGGRVGDDAEDELAALPSHPGLATIFGAISDRRTLTFGYRGEERSVEPLRLDFQRGRWYVTGHDRLRDGERVFRLDRIEGDVVAGAPAAFDRPAEPTPGRQLRPWELGDETATEAVLLVDPDQALWAVHHLGPDALAAEREDGSVLLRVPVTDRGAFRSFVLTFLDHAEILEPAQLRDDMVRWLEAIAG